MIPPITAMMNRSSVGPMPIEFGSICPFHQMLSTPAIPATNPARVNASVRWSWTLKPSDAIRTGSSRTPCSAMPNGVRAIARNPAYASTESASAA